MTMQRIGVSTLALAMALGGTAFSAQAQDANQQQQNQQQQNQQAQQGQQQQDDIQVLSAWNYDELYAEGITGEQMLDADVHGPDGEEIGSVENVIVSQDDQIVAIIAQVGGFWDIGDTHIAVPWDQVQMVQADDGGFQIPVTEDTVGDYGLYGDETIVDKQSLQDVSVVDDDLTAGPRTWKLTNLLNDYATLRGGVGYGYVSDVVFSRDGALEAVVVQPDYAGYGMGGAFAYPFYGQRYGWQPGADYYEMPYAEDELADVEPFEYDDLETRWEMD